MEPQHMLTPQQFSIRVERINLNIYSIDTNTVIGIR